MVISLSLLLIILQASSLCLSTVLDDYVSAPDDAYSYRALREPYKGDGFTTYFLNMTSQKWLTGMTWNVNICYLLCNVQFTIHPMLINTCTMGSNHISRATLIYAVYYNRRLCSLTEFFVLHCTPSIATLIMHSIDLIITNFYC